MKSKISIITLGVSDFDRSFAFYCKGLGFQPHNYSEGENYVMLEMEGTWLALCPKETLIKDVALPIGEPGLSEITLAQNVASKEMVDQVFKEALAVGATVIKEPQDAFWGGYSGYFADPDGYLWEVAYNPYTDLS
ncbi:MAG: VOC family protein [bacterium]|nr:VOC family protein [bacterium]